MTVVRASVEQAVADVVARVSALWEAWRVRDIPPSAQPYLARVGLDAPQDFQAKVAQRLPVLELTARLQAGRAATLQQAASNRTSPPDT